MSVNTLRYAQGENISDTLSTSIGSSDTTIPVSTISKWSSNGGCVIIDRNTSSEEIIACSGVSGSSLVVASGGRGFDSTTAVGHNAGATIESVPLAKDWNDVITSLLNILKQADGNIDITKLGSAEYAADSGSANAYAITLSPVAASYTTGMVVRFKAGNANTGESTLNINSLGTKTIKKLDGATDLVSGDIKSGQLVTVVYDGTYFQMCNPSATVTNAPTDGWTSSSDTWTYVSSSSFKISGVDRTATFTKGTRVKCTNNSTTFYGVVISSSFSTDTTVTLAANNDYSLANSAITNPYYSYQQNPQGYPTWFNYTPTYSASGSMTFTSVTTTFAKFKIDGSAITLEIRAVGTLGGTANQTISATYPVTPIDTGNNFRLVGNIDDGSGAWSGFCYLDTTKCNVRRYDAATLTLGSSSAIYINGTYVF